MKFNSEVHEIIREASIKQNLKKHSVLETSTGSCYEIYGPADIEIHKGKASNYFGFTFNLFQDDRYYVIDSARVFPPEAPKIGLIQHPRSIFFNLLRPGIAYRPLERH